jgi:hypothetical protein
MADMSVWVVPLAFGFLCAMLALASRLETQRVRVMVRMTVRSKTSSPELAEALIAAELAPVLAAHGFDRS